MRTLIVTVVLAIALEASAGAANPKDCFTLSVSQDQDVSSPSGIRVTVTGRSQCSESVDGSQVWFKVKATDRSSKVIGSQQGRFGGTVAPGGSAETKVFVVCDPYNVSSVSVD
jgi:hypothetical protein